MVAHDIDFKNLKILIIDDEDFIRRLIARVLYELGIDKVTEAGDGEEALKTVNKTTARFDAIICDLEMPKVNGIEFVRRLRQIDNISLSRTPVLILTGHSVEKNIAEIVELGIHGFLAKPVSKGILEQRLVTALTSPPIDPKVLRNE